MLLLVLFEIIRVPLIIMVTVVVVVAVEEQELLESWNKMVADIT